MATGAGSYSGASKHARSSTSRSIACLPGWHLTKESFPARVQGYVLRCGSVPSLRYTSIAADLMPLLLLGLRRTGDTALWSHKGQYTLQVRTAHCSAAKSKLTGVTDSSRPMSRSMPWSLMNEYAANGELLETRPPGSDQAEAWLLAWVSLSCIVGPRLHRNYC